MEHGQLTEELCSPSEKTIIKQVILFYFIQVMKDLKIYNFKILKLENALKKTNANIVYVATDDKDMIAKFEKRFKNVYEN